MVISGKKFDPQNLVVSVVATQLFFMFTPKFGEMMQFDEHVFQMDWLKPPTSCSLIPNFVPQKFGCNLCLFVVTIRLAKLLDGCIPKMPTGWLP